MFRFAGQFLAIIAVMASAINAQCAVSCLLQPVTMRSAGHEAKSVQAPRNLHPCCPGQNTAAPHGKERHQQQQPCPIPIVTTSDLAVSNLIEHSDTPRLFYGPALPSLDRDLPVRQYAPPVFVDSSGIPDIPAFAILRI
jgi:hypothetical protein